MTELDDIDVRILDVLQQEARIPILALADRVGLSPTPCARRVRRLERTGVIRAYMALVDPDQLGVRLHVFVRVRLRSSTRKSVEIFEKAVREMPEVVECYLVTGAYDYLLHIRVADVETFRDFLRDRLITITSVGETESHIALEQTKQTGAVALTAAPANLSVQR
jgi:DNA-binding Lrp family transcriptional regulator